jgi:hypothetical protein
MGSDMERPFVNPDGKGLVEMWTRAFLARVQGREAAGISTGSWFV